MPEYSFEIDSPDLKHSVFGTMAFAGPAAVLGGLSAATAFKAVDGYAHTIARLVAHLNYWQQQFIASARGTANPRGEDFKLGVTDFPEVSADSWEQLRDQYLASFDELLEIAKDPAAVTPGTFGERSLYFVLTDYCLHNAYHLGQIVVMRQILGDWEKPVIPAA